MAHTEFKNALKAELHARVTKEVKFRAGPSWDERMEKSVKAFNTKARATEAEMTKKLQESVERGRSRPTSCPIRDDSLAPNKDAMLEARKKKMAEAESEYRDQLDRLRDKMAKREPLFRLSDVNAAFQMQRDRMVQRKREMTQDEHDRWEHLKTLEQAAASRPMLIEDPHYKHPKKERMGESASAPDLGEGGEGKGAKKPTREPGDRIEYEKDIKIRDAINSKWFQQTDWAKQVAAIRERADNRKKLHEEEYPNKGDRHALTRNRLMHTLPATVPAVY